MTENTLQDNTPPLTLAARDVGVRADAGDAACRLCGNRLQHVILDLGMSPLCQTVKPYEAIDQAEMFHPLRVYVCTVCWLVQLREYVAPAAIFSDYPYFSSFSDSWLAHARKYSTAMQERFDIDQQSLVVEIASNDGYLLRNFVDGGIPVLGVEPAANVAECAIRNGVPTLIRFFGLETAQDLVAQGKRAQLLVGNNVLAHVPDMNDFVAGMKCVLDDHGVITMEFPHLVQLMRQNQFDTIYHEHFSYLSLQSVTRLFEQHELELFDVEPLASHGGSLRIYAQHSNLGRQSRSSRLETVGALEREAGLDSMGAYEQFATRVQQTKQQILRFFLDARDAGKRVAGYGAPGKGVTLLHYCGINVDFLEFTVDRNPHKQGAYMPGTSIPIRDPGVIATERPDYLFLLPWNLKQEIVQQQQQIRGWGGKFVVPIPSVEIF